MKRLITSQLIILLAGTLFAWGNFIVELVDFLNKRACSTECVVGVVNPLLTPCFYGAIVFTIAFVLSAVILKKYKQTK